MKKQAYWKRTVSMWVALMMFCGLLVGIVPTAMPHAHALNATSVVLTATDGSTTQLTDQDVEAATYSWVAETATLTLNGYSGRSITTNGEIKLHLKGTNTLTMDPDATNTELIALNLDYNTVYVSADDGGTLNIEGNIQTQFSAIAGYVWMMNGTVNIDVETSSGGWLYGFERGLYFDSQTSDAATVNVNIERTGASNYGIYGIYNGVTVENRGNVTLNVSLKGSEDDTLVGATELNVTNASPQIQINLDNGEGPFKLRQAINSSNGIALTAGGRVELNGRVRCSNLPYVSNVHTVTTTPANNAYIWLEDNTTSQSGDFLLCNLSNGTPCETVVFEYADEPAVFEWVGGSYFDIPGGKVDDNVSLNLLAGIHGAHSYQGSNNSYWSFSIIEGTLPEGLYLGYGGALNGQIQSPCEAGSVKIRGVDRAGSLYDETDDREIEFTISYGAYVDKDRFLTVGNEDPLEMKQDGSGTGWSYVAETKTLTLSGYAGGPIKAEGAFNLHLDGENTITLSDSVQTEGYYNILSYGIWINTEGDRFLTVTAEDDGVLNLNGAALTKGYAGMCLSNVEIVGGTVNMNLASDFSNASGDYYGLGVYGAITVQDTAEPVEVNMTLKDLSETYVTRICGNYNSLTVEDSADVTVNIDVQGNENTRIEGINYLSVYQSCAKIRVKTYDGGLGDALAVNGITSLSLTEGGSVDLEGIVESYSFPSTLDPHTVTTTPSGNAYVWYDTNSHPYHTLYQLRDLYGNPIQKVVFEYSDTIAALKWTGEGQIAIPAGSLGDPVQLDVVAGIRGAHRYSQDSSYWHFEIVAGTLPQGLSISSYSGMIAGTVSAPCKVGEVTIRATDRAGTYSDTTDDRVIEFTLNYGAYTTNNPVTGIALNKDSVVMEQYSTSDIVATVTPSNAAYPNVTGELVGGDGELSLYSVSNPVEGVSTVTIKSWGISGKYTFRIKTVELGLYRDVTVYVKEEQPAFTIDYTYGELRSVQVGVTYRISGDGFDPVVVTPEVNSISIPDAWLGKTISIVKVNDEEALCNSSAQELVIPSRPAAPTVGKTDASSSVSTDGTLTDVNNTMEYRKEGSSTWLQIYSTTVENLGIGTYQVRYRGTAEAFSSQIAEVVIGYGEFNVVDNDAFDIPGGMTNYSIDQIDVSTGVSGGKAPYTYAIEGPAWLTINASTGVISGLRPNTEQDATTATVTVTDGDSISKEITINVGAVSAPHVCEFDQQVTTPTYKKHDADCESAAVYYYSCTCGAKGDQSFTYEEKLGHDYTEKLQDGYHIKAEGADCQHKHTYWYDCSRCGSISNTLFYEGEAVGAHSFGDAWEYKDASGHAHVCTVDGCDAHDTPVAHTPGDEASEFAPQLCTVCSYEIAPQKPHTHTIEKRNAQAPSCTETGNSLYYVCTGSCGKYFSDEAGTQEILDKTSVVLPAQGHDYSEKLQNDAHVKSGGTNCKELYVYWYNCSRCTACAKDDPEAEDKFYTGTLYGDHEFDLTKYDYRDLNGHAHVCKTEGCTTHDVVKNHVKDGTYQKDATNHWNVCSDCGYELAVAAHGYSHACDTTCNTCDYTRSITHSYADTLTKNAQKHWYECSVCGAKKEEADHVFDNACDTDCNTCGHIRSITHSYAAEWTKNESRHWHVCSVCGAKKDEADHAPGVAATESTPQTCTVCEYIIAPATGHVTHTPVDAWSKDATHHWHACVGCLEQQFEKAEHTYDNACDTDCNGCGYVRAITHDYPNEWSKNEAKHWHACSVCGAKKEEADHVFDNACDTACNTCGYTRTTTHSYLDAFSKTEAQHWHECSSCGARADEGDHVFDNTCDTTCDACGYTRAVSHDYAAAWSSNETRHWHACSVCGVRKDEASHEPGAAATETQPQTCTVCGYIITPATGHTTHTPASEWMSDADYHWHTCTGCAGQKLDSASHVYDNDCDVDCNVCGKTRTVTHNYKAEWQSNQTGHWHICSVCSAKKDEAPHTPGSAATENTPQACTVCGYILTPATGHTAHTPTNEWFSDATYHWHRCTGCEDQRVDLEAHTFGNWVKTDGKTHTGVCVCGVSETKDHSFDAGSVTTQPTYEEAGVKTYTCTGCGATVTEAIDMLVKAEELVSPDHSDVKITAPEGSSAVLNENTVLKVEEIPEGVSEEVQKSIESVVGDGSATLLISYDISLLLDGMTVQPGGRVEVTLPAPENAGAYHKLQVVYIDDEGNVTPCETRVNADGTITFETDHFSRYAVIGVNDTEEKGGLGAGAIVAIVIGAVLLLGIGGFAIWWFVISKKTLAELGAFFKRIATKIANVCNACFQRVKQLFKKK